MSQEEGVAGGSGAAAAAGGGPAIVVGGGGGQAVAVVGPVGIPNRDAEDGSVDLIVGMDAENGMVPLHKVRTLRANIVKGVRTVQPEAALKEFVIPVRTGWALAGDYESALLEIPGVRVLHCEENLKELDLTGNLISKWQDVGSICVALPALEILNLTNNLMESDIPELPQLKSIRVLVLNSCGISWKQIETLEQSLPSLEELHLMANGLRTITCVPVGFVQGFSALHLLNLEGNCIDAWDEILKLSHLRSLEQLHLNKNALKNISYPATWPEIQNSCEMKDGCFRPFENLQCLLLGGNEIADLASVDSLSLFPNLMDIRLSENPIADPAKGGVQRFVLVARLAKVKILNGSEVSPRERKDSEIRYVRHVMSQLQSDKSEEIDRLHPRYAELKAAYGIEDEKPSSGISGPQKMASGLLCITLKCVGASIGEKMPLTKKLPRTTTVGKLKGLCESFFNLKGIRPRLFILEEGSPLPQLIDDDMAPLMDLGIRTGTTILVDEEN